jgi:hypothetical protein
VIQEQKPLKKQEAELLLKELHEIATTIEPTAKKIAQDQTPSNLEAPQPLDKPLAGSEAQTLEALPLHWHFRYLEERDKVIERHKAKLLETLHTRGITLDHQTDELFIFTASGEKVEEILTQTLLSSQDIFFFTDFTQTVATLKEKNYCVSLYFESDSASLHWHISPLALEQRSNLFESIRSLGGVIEYQCEELVVFSLQQTEIEKLRMRIRAMRVGFLDFGQQESKDKQLISGPVKISLYLTK